MNHILSQDEVDALKGIFKSTPEKMDEEYYRMIAAGWKVHHGPITEKDISTHEFNMMGKLKFKKLKEAEPS